MYQRKHKTPANQKQFSTKKRSTALLASSLLLITCLVGTTVAYLFDVSSPIINIFTPSAVSCQVNEKSFENDIKTNVYITNTSNIPAYIRAAIIITWQDHNGNVYAVSPVSGQDYEIVINGTDWTYEGGYYYYNAVVPAGSDTASLIVSCSPVEGKAPAGYGLNVEILGSAIQADGMGATSGQEAWEIASNSQGGA